jgi:hypothetical protein
MRAYDRHWKHCLAVDRNFARFIHDLAGPCALLWRDSAGRKRVVGADALLPAKFVVANGRYRPDIGTRDRGRVRPGRSFWDCST